MDSDAPTMLIDADSMAILHSSDDGNNSHQASSGLRGSNRRNNNRNNHSSNASRTSRSQATTQIATEVGSVVGPRKNPFRKSITFFDPKVYYKRLAEEKKRVAETANGNVVLTPRNEDLAIVAEGQDDNSDNENSIGEEDSLGSAGGAQDAINIGIDDNSVASNNSNRNIETDDNSDAFTFEVNDLTHWEITLVNQSDFVRQDENSNNPPTTSLPSSSSPPTTTTQKRPSIVRKLSNKILQNKIININFQNNKSSLIIDDYEGLIEYSCFEHGDHLHSINNKKIKSTEYTPDQAMEYMQTCLQKEGVLHIQATNPHGSDILLNITIVKPRPEMGYHALGLQVWNWPYLCVREIYEGSIFKHTCMREGDQIAAINDIDCTKMKAKEFAKVVDELPGMEITITLVRRKHRMTASFS